MTKRVKVLTGILVVLTLMTAINWYLFLSGRMLVATTSTTTKFSYNALPIPESNFFNIYKFPVTVSLFTKSFGMPDETYIDDSEGCPVGQVHFWHLEGQNLKLIVLGNSYEKQVDYSKSSELYAVAKLNLEKPASFGGLWDINLGDTDQVVKEKLDALLKRDASLNLTQNSDGSPVHCLMLGKRMKHQYILSKDGNFLFFMIGENDKLELIMYTIIDIQVAC